MATGKRYYWIKLKDSFMSSDEIDYLMSQPDGANYVVLYQMLCLKTINTNGCLVSKIGEMLIPYDAEKIQRECKWFPLSTVRLALTVYKQIGLIFENPDGTLSISDYQNMIGSETDWAAKNRRIRSNAANKELQEGHDTGHTSGHNVSSDGGENVPTEKEIEKDKEIAEDAGVVNGCETGDGVVKFYSKEIPAADISTCIILFGKGGGGESDLTVATREQLGHVKIGNGIEVTEDGTISANAKVSEDQIATSDDTSEMLKEIYGE